MEPLYQPIHKTIFFMRGISGSGKTTFAKKELSFAKYCSADEYFYIINGTKQIYNFEADKLSEAHKYCFEKAVSYMENSHLHIVVDNTNLHLNFLKPYFAMAKKHKYMARIIQLHNNIESSFTRNVHDVSMEVLKKQYKNFIDEMGALKEMPNVKVYDVYK
jgi:predicted kinase